MTKGRHHWRRQVPEGLLLITSFVGFMVLCVIFTVDLLTPPPIPVFPADQQVHGESPFTRIDTDGLVPCEASVFLGPTDRCAPD